MQKPNFGPYIRSLRESQKTPLRKLAAALDIDTSTLSKIERQERYPNSTMIPVIADFFDLDPREVHIEFWTDKLVHELEGEAYIIEALKKTVELLENQEAKQ